MDDKDNSNADLNNKDLEKELAEAPKWHKLLQEIQKGFPSPWKEEEKDQLFEHALNRAIQNVNKLKHPRIYDEQSILKGYLGNPVLPDYSDCKKARMPEFGTPQDEVIDDIVNLFDGLPNWTHPLTMTQVIPPSNTSAIIGTTLCKMFNPDIGRGIFLECSKD